MGKIPAVRRLSPSSRLVLTSLVVAFVFVGVASAPMGGATSGSPSTGDATPTAGPPGAASTLPTQVVASGSAAPGSASPAPSATNGAGGSSTLASLVEQLPQAPEHRDGYSRNLFVHWIDTDGDGCDTRREVLIAEAAVPPDVGPGCHLSGGRWVSLYDGLVVTDASDLDIDHVVALAEAWDSGAYAWTSQRREGFANDLGVPWALIAVSAASNRSKGDRDPADWVPPLRAARCEFVVDWVAVKVRWQLTVDTAERQALLEFGSECTTTPVPSIPRP